MDSALRERVLNDPFIKAYSFEFPNDHRFINVSNARVEAVFSDKPRRTSSRVTKPVVRHGTSLEGSRFFS